MEKLKAKKKADGSIYRYAYEDEDTVFVYAPRAKRRGWRMNKKVFEDIFEPVREAITPTEKWHRRIRRVLEKLKNTGLWPELVPVYENCLKMTWEDLIEMRQEFWNRRQSPNPVYLSNFAAKYPFAYDKLSDLNTVLKWEYVQETANCRTKSMYFGRKNAQIKDDIKKALESKTDYSSGCIPVTYDVTFEYSAGKYKAWYSEEYRNTGNGHYYLAVDHNTAVFCEDD